MQPSPFAQWRANFFTGLAIVLPAVLSIALVVWLFGTVSIITDSLLIFVPKRWTHHNDGVGPMHWYWSLAAFTIAIALTTAIGRLARNYLGRKLIEWVDIFLLRVPLLNKIYGAIKQVNDAFSSNKTSFKQVVLVEFPRAGMHTIGFVTSDHVGDFSAKFPEKVVSVFVPTTPNPTSGFLMIVPESSLVLLDISIADGIKYIVSLGSLPPVRPPTGIAVKRPPVQPG